MNEKFREYFHLLWIAAITLCCAAALFCVVFVSCTRAPASMVAAAESTAGADRAADTASPGGETQPPADATPEPTAEPTPEPAPTELAETEDMGEEYLSKCIFLGDSTTYGLAAYNALPWQQMWTTSLGTLDLSGQSYVMIDVYDEDGSVESMSIRDAVRKYQPEILIVTLGLNGISYMDESDFKEEYTDLIGGIQAASPDTKIICNSIYPVIDSQAPEGISNERVVRANDWVRDVAQITGTRYLNTHDNLTDESGNLRADYCNGDGIHLDTPGCEAVLNTVRTHGYR